MSWWDAIDDWWNDAEPGPAGPPVSTAYNPWDIDLGATAPVAQAPIQPQRQGEWDLSPYTPPPQPMGPRPRNAYDEWARLAGETQRAGERDLTPVEETPATWNDDIREWQRAQQAMLRPTARPQGPETAPTRQPDPFMAAVQTWRQSEDTKQAQGFLDNFDVDGQPPDADPWQNALNAWQNKPPSLNFQYDVSEPAAQELGYERPDLGAPGVGASGTFAPTDTLTNRPMQGPAWRDDTLMGQAYGAFGDAVYDWGTNSPFIKNVESTISGQMEYAKQGSQERLEEGFPAWLDNLAYAGDVTNVTWKIPANATIPGTGYLLDYPANVAIGDVLSAGGGLLNKTLNPLNPNAYTAEERATMQKEIQAGASPFEVFGFDEQLRQATEARATLEQLPEDQRTEANMALINTISGSTKETLDNILTQDAQVNKLYQQAEQARINGDELNAAEYARQAEKLKNKRAIDLVDEQTNWWAEFLGGVLLDPTNLVGIGAATETKQAAKAWQLVNMGEDEALQSIDEGLKAAKGVVDQVVGQVADETPDLLRLTGGAAPTGKPVAFVPDNKGGLTLKTYWDSINPFARTAQTNADAASNELFQTAAIVFGKATEKEEALALAQHLVGDPSTLVREGITAPGVVGNQEFTRNLPVLHLAAEDIANMKSLQGAGPFNPVEFLSEFGEIVGKHAKTIFGVQDTSAVTNLFTKQADIQRALMSDLWLNLRPAHWIRNAASATATLMADDLYTLKPTRDIIASLGQKLGALPTERLMEGAGGAASVTGGGQSIFRKLGPLGAPIAALAEKGGQVWSGMTDIAGRVPFGEQNFYLRAFSEPFNRFVGQHWEEVANQHFLQPLLELGIDEGLARNLTDLAVNAGVRGGKGDVLTAVRGALAQTNIPKSLRTLNIAPDTFALETWKQLDAMLGGALPDQIDEVAGNIRQLVQGDAERWLRMVNVAPPQPTRAAWTEFTQAQDGAEIIDGMTQAARRMGVDLTQAKQEAVKFVQDIIGRERQQWDMFRQELTQNQNPATFDVAIDLWAKIDELKRLARAKVDEAGKLAIQQNTPQAWGKKWEETRRIYGQLPDLIGQQVDEARLSLARVESGQTPRRTDFWSVAERYIKFDEEKTRLARAAGSDLGSPQEAPELWKRVMDANRQYVDMSQAEVMSAFRRYSSQDALDVIATTQRRVEALGAQAAGYLAELRDRAQAGQMSWDQFYQARNATWNSFFDHAVLTNKAATYEIVLDGLAQQAASGLRWVDEFSGGDFKLLRPDGEGFWLAKRGDGEVLRFADPGKLKPGDTATLPQVPQEVMSDYYRILGQQEKVVEQTVADIGAEVAPRVAPTQLVLQKKIEPTGASYAQFLDPEAVNDTPIPSRLEQTFAAPEAPGKEILKPLDKPTQAAPQTLPDASGAVTGAVVENPVNELRQLARDAGIATATETGANLDKRLISTLNKDLSLGISKLSDLTPQQLEQAKAALQARAEMGARPRLAEMAKEQLNGLKEAKAALQEQWDKAAAQIKGLPPLKELLMRLGSRDVGQPTATVNGVNWEDSSQIVELAEKLLGPNGKGADVLDWLREYSRLTKQADNAQAAIKDAKFFSKMSKEEILTFIRDNKLMGEDQITGLQDLGRRDILDFLAGEQGKMTAAKEVVYEAGAPAPDFADMEKRLQARLEERARKPYDLKPFAEGEFNPWGLADKTPQDARKIFKLLDSGAQKGNVVTPEMGDVALHMLNNANQAAERIIAQLPNLLGGTPNTLSDVQRLRAIDALNKVAAQYDAVLAGAVKTGQKVADFAMLNYNDRRNIDTLLGMVIPYHYFWSRSAKNWVQRTMQKPALLNFYYEANRAIEGENQQNNIPQHLQGTLPIPGTNYRVANPLNYALPFGMYAPSSFVDPSEATSETERWVKTIQQWTPGLLPALDYAQRLVTDKLSPLPNNKKRTDDVTLGGLVPQYRAGGYAYQSATGQMAPDGFMSWGDEYDYGRAGKQVALNTVGGGVDPDMALWGLDVGYQQQKGAEALPEQPAGAGDVWQQGAKDAGWNRALTTWSGYLGGFPVYEYSPEEKQMRAMKETRANLGYDAETNLYGSNSAVKGFDSMTGEALDPAYSYRQLYPTEPGLPAPPAFPYKQPFEPERPGVQAAGEMKADAKAALQADMSQAVEAYLKEHPNAKNSELYAVKQPFYDKIEALDQQYPSAPTFDNGKPATLNFRGADPTATTLGGPDFYGNYSPEELQAKAQENAVWAAKEELADLKPAWPGDGATKAQIAAYYKQKEAYDGALEKRVGEMLADPRLMSSLVGGRPMDVPTRPGEGLGSYTGATGPMFPEMMDAGWGQGPENLTGPLPGAKPPLPGSALGATPTTIRPPIVGQGGDAAGVIQGVEQQGMTEAEKALRAKNETLRQQNGQEWANRRGGVVTEFGKEAVWDNYYNLPKGEARQRYAQENPTIKLMNLYAYNGAEYAKAKELFGQDAMLAWAKAPAYADTAEAKANRALYWDKNPNAWLFHNWLNGRPASGDESDPGEGFKYNFGQDYQTAQEMFGKDIWQLASGYKRGWGKDEKKSYFTEHPQLTEFFNWWYGGLPKQAASAGYTQARGRAGGGYGGGGGHGGGGGGGHGGGGSGRTTPYQGPKRIYQDVAPRAMAGFLMPTEDEIRGFRPAHTDLSWLQAGANLRPDRPRAWRPLKL